MNEKPDTHSKGNPTRKHRQNLMNGSNHQCGKLLILWTTESFKF